MSKLRIVCSGGTEALCKQLVFALVQALEGEEKGGSIPSHQPSCKSPMETWGLGFLTISYWDIWQGADTEEKV